MDSSVVLFLAMISAVILTYLAAKALVAWFGRYDAQGLAKSPYNDRLFYTLWVLLLIVVVYAVPQLVTSPHYAHALGKWRSLREM